MIEPLPKLRSIWASAASSALDLLASANSTTFRFADDATVVTLLRPAGNYDIGTVHGLFPFASLFSFCALVYQVGIWSFTA
jgi:hypothetical protein